MANTSRVRGFTPIRHLNGSAWDGRLNIYYHSTANASAIYKGALVCHDAGLAIASTDPLSIYPGIIIAPDETPNITGVAWSFGETPQLATRVSNLNAVNYCPASTGMYIGVIDDPSVVFEIEDNGTTLTAAQIGTYFDTSNNAAGSTTTGRSSAVIDQGSVSASTSAACQILRLVNRADNSLCANAKFEVIINEHIYKDAHLRTT